MSEIAEDLEMRAADMYASGSTFGVISKELDVSKSRVGDLIRGGIDYLKNNHHDGEPAVQDVSEQEDEQELMPERIRHLLSSDQNLRPETYQLETIPIQKTVKLTPKALEIFNIFRYCGFTGDLSDFLEDGVNFLYYMVRPSERSNPRGTL